MPLMILAAVAAAAASSTTKPHKHVNRPTVTVSAPKTPPVDPAAMMAMMSQLFDKLFPAGPDPDPVRLAAARGTVQTMFPNGTYSQAMTHFFNGMIDHGLAMSEADFAAMVPAVKPGKDAKPPSTVPLRQALAAKDPNFDAKLAAVRAFMGQSFVKLGTVAEPKLREGMARSLARKFDPAQLAEINAFLATPTGRAYGQQTVGMWFEPDVLRGAVALFPEMMKMLPDMMKDSAVLEAQIKSLDKPKPADSTPKS
jgi:hypothetical protein